MSSFPTRVHLKQWQGFHLNLNSVHPGFRQCEHVWRITALGLLRGLRVWRIVAWPPRRVHLMGFPGGASGKEPVCQCRRCKRQGSIPRLGSSPGGGHGNPLQYSCLENPLDKGVWWATLHRGAKRRTGPKRLSTASSPVLLSRLCLTGSTWKKPSLTMAIGHPKLHYLCHHPDFILIMLGCTSVGPGDPSLLIA